MEFVKTLANSKLVLLPFGVADIESIIDIERRCHVYPWSEGVLKSCIGERYLTIKACQEDNLVGFYVAELMLDEITLMDICVVPNHQGQGFGKQLLIDLIHRSRQLGAVKLLLEVRYSNYQAIAVYLQLGFTQLGIRKDYYPCEGGREDAIVMHYLI